MTNKNAGNPALRPLGVAEMKRESNGTYYLPEDVEVIYIDLSLPPTDDGKIIHASLSVQTCDLTEEPRLYCVEETRVSARWDAKERDITLVSGPCSEIKRVWFYETR